MDKAKRSTEKSKKIFMDQKKICSYGKARYIEYKGVLSDEFFAAVRELPVDYCRREEKLAYLRFIEEWGTVSCIIRL